MQPNYALYLVKPGDNLWKIARSVFGLSGNGETARKVSELLNVNRHLGNGDHIRPGQLIILDTQLLPTSPDALAADLDSAGDELSTLSADDQDLLWNNFEEFSVIQREITDDYQSPILSSVGLTPSTMASSMGPEFQATQSMFVKVPKHALRWLKAGAEGYKGAANGNFGRLMNIPTHSIVSLEGELVRGVGNQARYLRMSNNTARMIPKGARALQIGNQVTIVQPTSSGFMSLTKTMRDHKELAGKLKTGAKAVGIVFDLGVGAANVAQDWDTDKRYYTAGAETTKFVGKQLIGKTTLAPAIAGGVCTLLTFTTGPGGVVCFVAVYGLANWGISASVDAAVDYGATKLYESSHPIPIN